MHRPRFFSLMALAGLLACDVSAPPGPPPRPGDTLLPGRPSGPVARALLPRAVITAPTRATTGPDGRLYVTDTRQGALFILEDVGRVVGQIKGLRTPLGVAVSRSGEIFVGSGDRRRVEVFGPNGRFRRAVGAGALRMPNDLALDSRGYLYVADSAAHVVRVYDASGRLSLTLEGPRGAEEPFRFPSAVAIGPSSGPLHGRRQELYVADQGRGKVHVFSLDGRHLRSFGDRVPGFSSDWEGRFVRLQALALDESGLVYALDSRLGVVQVFDGATGRFLRKLGDPGPGPGQLRLPLGLTLRGGSLVVANAGNGRLDRLPTRTRHATGGNTP